MKNKILYLLEVIILAFIIILKTIFIDNLSSYHEIVNVVFWVSFCFLAYKLLGIPKNSNSLKTNTTQIIIIAILGFVLISYLSGMYFGFLKNAYSLSIINILKNTYSLFIMIVSQELIRFMIANKCRNNLKPYIILTTLFILLDIILTLNTSVFESGLTIFIYITNVVLPMISRHILISYLTYKVSYLPGIILRLFFTLYVFIIPIFPDYGYYISSIIGIILPYFIYIVVSKMIFHAQQENIKPLKAKRWFINIPIIFVLLSIIILVSGIFKYQIMAIGSGSMEPYIALGDAVIFEKVENQSLNNLQTGDIIVFRHKGKYITHRIVKIIIEDSQILYQTKGDNNEKVDDYKVKKDDIKGIVKMKIKYLGIPSIWFQELLNES